MGLSLSQFWRPRLSSLRRVVFQFNLDDLFYPRNQPSPRLLQGPDVQLALVGGDVGGLLSRNRRGQRANDEDLPQARNRQAGSGGALVPTVLDGHASVCPYYSRHLCLMVLRSASDLLLVKLVKQP
jgi:hypothetical protein